VGVAQGREWSAGGVGALEAVTEGFLRLWTEHRQHLERQQAERDEAFRYATPLRRDPPPP
jgi:hypothetical protein